MQSPFIQHPASYRDPSGFLFYYNHILYRQVNKFFKSDFDEFISSGLYSHLVKKQMLVPHHTIQQNLTGSDEWYQTLQPDFIPFISYPYEWCFDMLKDAALLTIEAAKEAMNFGMLLKDASAYNVQWYKGKMTFIDSLSFEQYNEKKSWIAYRQFCEHFLAPLALVHYLKKPFQNLLITYPDGIPLHTAKKILPGKSKFNLNIFLNLHLHSTIAEKPKSNQVEKPFSTVKLKNLLKSLEESISFFSCPNSKGDWSGYYEEVSRRQDYLIQKKQIVESWLKKNELRTAIDIGSNEGEFSELIADQNIYTISVDSDHLSINKLYKRIKNKNKSNVHPLLIDVANPSPAIGLNNIERASFLDRVQTDIVVALAFIHHLAIGKNIPFDSIAKMFQLMGKRLIIEFVPKTDEKIQFMLKQKKDVYQWYSHENFLNSFASLFKIEAEAEIGNSKRVLYLMAPHEN